MPKDLGLFYVKPVLKFPGKLPDGWERSETANGIPYYVK